MRSRCSLRSLRTLIALTALVSLALGGCGSIESTESEVSDISSAPTSSQPSHGAAATVEDVDNDEDCESGVSGCRSIRSDGIGVLTIGMQNSDFVADGWTFDPFADGSELDCGYLSTDDGGVSAQSYDGQVEFVQTDDPNDRTHEGVGPGSTYGELKAEYPGKLEVYTNRGIDSFARFRPVAIVRQDGNAITFKMDSPSDKPLPDSATVDLVKVSTWDWRGDDEGCA